MLDEEKIEIESREHNNAVETPASPTPPPTTSEELKDLKTELTSGNSTGSNNGGSGGK